MSEQGASRAGWYPDPSGTSQLLYWDGTTWRTDVAPRPMTPSQSDSASGSFSPGASQFGQQPPLVAQRDYSTPRVEEKGRGWAVIAIVVFLGLTVGVPLVAALVGIIVASSH